MVTAHVASAGLHPVTGAAGPARDPARTLRTITDGISPLGGGPGPAEPPGVVDD
jgi:hypothetical protein